ncbi:MAG: NADH-quinone oxidoreductase subunit A [Candidatus Anammoxibacter sp.]
MLINYLPILLLITVASLFAVGTVIASTLIGKRKSHAEKLSTYECGVEPIGSARVQFPIKFYIIAMVFIVFDIELVFLYPWAVVFKSLRMFGFIEMGVFILILGVCYFYIWKRGVFEWE